MPRRSTTTRETVITPTSSHYTRHDSHGRFTDIDARSRSLTADRRATAKRTVIAGFGGQGDPRRRPR